MFTINIYLKFALIALGIIGGTALSIGFGFWYGFPFILAGILLLVSYFLLGTIQSAGTMLQAEDFEGAKKRLDLTYFPNLLYTTNRAYYYMLNGSISQMQGDHTEAEAHFKKAGQIEVPTDNEKAMLELQFANNAARKNNWNQVKAHMKTLKGLNVTMPEVKAQIAQFDQAMKQQGQMKAAMRQGGGQKGYRPGGKRRRPKMR